MRMENAKDKMLMKERGWKMWMTKNKNDNIGTRGNKFKMLLNILGCEIGSREFKDRNSFLRQFTIGGEIFSRGSKCNNKECTNLEGSVGRKITNI